VPHERDAPHEAGEIVEGQGLRTIREGVVRARMNLDDQAVGPGRYRREREWLDEVPLAGAVARVADHRQMGEALDQRNRRDVHRVARGGLEGADAALAEHHARVALREDVFGRQQQLLDRRRHPALEQPRLRLLATGVEQREVLHVAGADLEDICVLRDQIHVLRRHHLGDHRHACLMRGGRKQLQPLFSQSAYLVGRSQRPECPSAQLGGAQIRVVGRELPDGGVNSTRLCPGGCQRRAFGSPTADSRILWTGSESRR